MIPIAIEEIESLGLGELNGFGEITGLEIDSRRVGPGDLFVAIRGGREFVGAARDRGAATLVPNDEFDAMAVLGQALRGRSRARFVGVTGSTGKTSTKDILAALCSNVAPTVWTEGSYNAELGVPLTLGRLEPETEICIVEMGMRGFGQIAELCEIVRPHVGVISAVGPVHLELVGSVDGVARSKAELVAALPPDGIAIVPGVGRPGAAPADRHRDPAGCRRSTSSCATDGAHVAFGERRIRFPLTSRHQAQNALTALTAYEAMDLPLDRLEEGAARRAALEVARRGAPAARRRLRRQRRLQREPDLDGGGAAAPRRARRGPAAARDPRRHGRARRPRGEAPPRDRGARGRARDRGARGRRARARLRRGGAGSRMRRPRSSRARASSGRATPSSSRRRAPSPSKASPRPWRTTRRNGPSLHRRPDRDGRLGRDRAEVHRVPAPERARPADPRGRPGGPRGQAGNAGDGRPADPALRASSRSSRSRSSRCRR